MAPFAIDFHGVPCVAVAGNAAVGDAGHLELNGYAGDAVGADGDLVVTLAGHNSVTESHAPDADIAQCGMEVWGDLTLRGSGSLAASGSQCAIHVSRALVVDGRTVDARADGANVTGEAVAGVIAGDMAVRGGGRVVAVGAAPTAGARAYGVYMQDAGAGDGPAGRGLSVDASWLDAAGTHGGVGCAGGSLASARFVAPACGAFGTGGAVDASGAIDSHVVIEPEGAKAPAGETDGREAPGDAGGPAGGAASSVERPGAGSATEPTLKPATATLRTTATTKTTVTKTTASTPSKAKTASAAAVKLPKTADDNWIAASLALFLLGTAILGRPKRKGD